MREIDKLAESLFDKIRSRFENITLGDIEAKSTSDPEKARFFNFEFTVAGEDCGNLTVSVADGKSLKIYFDMNMTHRLSKEQSDQWFAFLKGMRFFAMRNELTFEPRDITRNNLNLRDLKTVGVADGAYVSAEVAESKLYGSSKTSYQKVGPVKIIVRHQKRVSEEVRGARSRHIDTIFIETSEGERIKLPFANLTGARAMAQHVKQGGAITDDIGSHITSLVEEMQNLRVFVRTTRGKTFEDATTAEMVESAIDYYGQIHSQLHRAKGDRGYGKFCEEMTNSENAMEDFNEDDMRDRFTRRSFDERIESSLASVHKAYKMKQEQKKNQDTTMSQEFAEWATDVTEGTWKVPGPGDIPTLTKIMSEPISVGTDGINAIGAIGTYIGDDDLYEVLYNLSKDDSSADARSAILGWLKQNQKTIYDAIITAANEVDEEVDQYDKQADFVDDVTVSTDDEEDTDEDNDRNLSYAMQEMRRLSGL